VAAPPQEPPARLQAADVSSLRVSGQQEQGTALNVRLSPDGKTVVYMGRDGTCVRGVDGSNERCLPLGVGLDISSADSGATTPSCSTSTEREQMVTLPTFGG
jgi:hypothetical protein